MRSRAPAASLVASRPAAAFVTLLAAGSTQRASAQAETDGPVQLPPPSAEEVQSGPPLLTFGEAVARALARNPTALVAYEEIRRAVALVEQTRSSSFPTAAGTITYTRLDHDRAAAATALPLPSGGALTIPSEVFAPKGQLGAVAPLTLPLVAPKPWAQWSHSLDNVDVARASAADVRRTIAIAVGRAYLTIVAQKRVIEAAIRARDTDRAHYEFARQRYLGGVGNRIDEVRAEQQVQSDEALLQQDYSGLATDREALGVLVGAAGPLDAEEPNLKAPMDERQGLRDAERRADVRLADERLRAAQHTVRDDWTDYMPYLTGVFEPFYWDPPTVTQPAAGWQAQLIFTVPIYDGGLRYGQEKERGALRDEAGTNLEGVLRQARSDVRTAFEEVRRSDSALAASRQAAELAHAALDLAQTAYRGGASTDIEVIDAERTARDAETAVAVAEDTARQARLDLLAATGRFP